MTGHEASQLKPGAIIHYNAAPAIVTEAKLVDGMARVTFRQGRVTLTTSPLDPRFDAKTEAEVEHNLSAYRSIFG